MSVQASTNDSPVSSAFRIGKGVVAGMLFLIALLVAWRIYRAPMIELENARRESSRLNYEASR